MCIGAITEAESLSTEAGLDWRSWRRLYIVAAALLLLQTGLCLTLVVLGTWMELQILQCDPPAQPSLLARTWMWSPVHMGLGALIPVLAIFVLAWRQRPRSDRDTASLTTLTVMTILPVGSALFMMWAFAPLWALSLALK